MKSASNYEITRETPGYPVFRNGGKAKGGNRGTRFSAPERDKGRTSIDERNCGTTMTSSTTSQYDVTDVEREGLRSRR